MRTIRMKRMSCTIRKKRMILYKLKHKFARAGRDWRAQHAWSSFCLLRYRIKQQRECRKALASVLRAKAEQYYFAFADGEFDKGCLAGDLFGTERPA